MNLWKDNNSSPTVYPWLSDDESCDICIIGGGLTGLFTALNIMESNKNIIILTSLPIGNGNTSKGMGIADIYTRGGFKRLCDNIGVTDAVNVYKKMKENVISLKEAINKYSIECDLEEKDVFYFTNDDEKESEFSKEFLPLKHSGFDIEQVSKNECLDMFSFEIKRGLLFKNGGITLNPYKLARGIASILTQNNVKIFENTSAENISSLGTFTLIKTSTGRQVKTKKAVFATGINSKDFIKGCGIKKTSYNIVTQPINEINGWNNGEIIHCIDRPTFTCILTKDKRIMASGLDTVVPDDFFVKGYNPFTRFRYNRFNQLEEFVSEMFPAIDNVSIEYKFTNSTLQNISDLPLAGALENHQNCYYTVCGGINSIVQAKISADVLCSGKPIVSDSTSFTGLI